MTKLFCFSDTNWISVLVATILAFAIGFLWYSVLFKNRWQKEVGVSEDKMKKVNMPLIFGLAFLLNFISAIFLSVFIGAEATLCSGLVTGLVISLAFVATALGTNYLFAQKSLALYLIDAGYFVTYYAVMGAVLGAWK